MTSKLPTLHPLSFTDKLHREIYSAFVKPYLQYYLKKPRWYKYEKLKLRIYPGVFHPAFFFSTGLFANFIKELDLRDKTVCEVGAGSGLLSFIAYSRGAIIYSLDINETAVEGVKENLSRNFNDAGRFYIYHSDLFDDVPEDKYDVFLIAPPYYFSDPQTDSSFAWYCGKNGEYFEKLFRQIAQYSKPSSQIYMNLADCCDLQRISDIAEKHNYQLDLVHEKKIRWEQSFIFEIVPKAPRSQK